MSPNARALVAATAMVALSCLLSAQSRDAAPNRVSMTGTATISGRVVVDDTAAKPLRRVTIGVTDVTGATPSRMAVTDDAGRFAVRNLPAGRYNVASSRVPYLSTAYGAKRVTRPGMVATGTPITVADGQNIAGITIKMARGAVISGVVRDANGQPGPGFSVVVSYFQRSPATGERTLVQYYGGANATTDDRGMYRMWGLPPGEYVVSAVAFSRMMDVVPTTDVDVQRALDVIQRPGSPSTPVPATASPRRPTVGYVPVYFPGTTTLGNATPVTLEAGQERSGVDFQIQLVATARIEGTIYGVDRSPVAGVSVRVLGTAPLAGPMDFVLGNTAVSDAKGRYVVNGVAPGAYSVQARSGPSGPVPAGVVPQVSWAAVDVSVQGQDLAVDLNLESALTVTGRIVLDGAAPPPDFTRIRVLLSQASAVPGIGMPSVVAAADGTFTIPGVVPGRYRLIASSPSAPSMPNAWIVKSSSIGDQDALDATVDIRAGMGGLEAVVTMTDRTTEISGTMSDATGRPAPDYFIIVFPADRALWVPTSRRILQTRPAQDGKYTFRNLPPGDYLIAAVTDVEQGQWLDPAFLAQLVDAGAKITLADNEKKIQDIRIR